MSRRRVPDRHCSGRSAAVFVCLSLCKPLCLCVERQGMRCLHRWYCSFLEFLAYKATHPCPIGESPGLPVKVTCVCGCVCGFVHSCYAHRLTDVQMWRRSWAGGRPRQASSTSVWAGTTTTRRNSRYGPITYTLHYKRREEGVSPFQAGPLRAMGPNPKDLTAMIGGDGCAGDGGGVKHVQDAGRPHGEGGTRPRA